MKAKECVAKIFFDIDDEVHEELVAEAVTLALASNGERAPSKCWPTTDAPPQIATNNAVVSDCDGSPRLAALATEGISSSFPIVEMRGVIKKTPLVRRSAVGTSRSGHEIQVRPS